MEAYFLTDFYVICVSGEPARKLAASDNAQAIAVDDLRHENADRAARRKPRVTGYLGQNVSLKRQSFYCPNSITLAGFDGLMA